MNTAFVHFLKHTHAKLNGYCKVCKQNNNTLFNCGSCLIGVYCSKACQNIDYPLHGCKNIGNFANVPTDVIRSILEYMDKNDIQNFLLVAKWLTTKIGPRWIESIPIKIDVNEVDNIFGRSWTPYITKLHINIWGAFKASSIIFRIIENEMSKLESLTLDNSEDLGSTFGAPITNLPKTLSHFEIRGHYSPPEGTQYIPIISDLTNLTHLVLPDNVPGDVGGRLPNSVTHLTVGDEWGGSVDDLPDSITHLTIGDDWNGSVDDLPKSLKQFTSGDGFNQPIDNLPNTITHLNLGYSFNRLINNLPKSITHLTLGKQFSQPIDNRFLLLLQNLTYLVFRNPDLKATTNTFKNLDKLTHLEYSINGDVDMNNKPPLLNVVRVKHFRFILTDK